jgi:undecaprenyl pyrophosphate phosphatase UppP
MVFNERIYCMLFISFWIAAQIILEMLPISSSGHLWLLRTVFKHFYAFDVERYFSTRSKDLAPSERGIQKNIDIKTVYYFLHGFTLAVILLYFGTQWIGFVFHDATIDFKPLLWVGVADSITAFFYFLLQKKTLNIPLSCGFIITALCLFLTAWCSGTLPITEWNFMEAVILGLAQSVALLPGISRLALSVAVACWLGFSLIDTLSLSWMIQAPLMGAACAKSSYELLKTCNYQQLLNLRMGLVMLISSGISWYALRLVVYTVQENMLYLFGWYMFVPLIVWGLMHPSIRNRTVSTQDV